MKALLGSATAVLQLYDAIIKIQALANSFGVGALPLVAEAVLYAFTDCNSWPLSGGTCACSYSRREGCGNTLSSTTMVFLHVKVREHPFLCSTANLIAVTTLASAEN